MSTDERPRIGVQLAKARARRSAREAEWEAYQPEVLKGYNRPRTYYTNMPSGAAAAYNSNFPYSVAPTPCMNMPYGAAPARHRNMSHGASPACYTNAPYGAAAAHNTACYYSPCAATTLCPQDQCCLGPSVEEKCDRLIEGLSDFVTNTRRDVMHTRFSLDGY